VLRRARNVRAQIGADNIVRVVRHDETVDCGPRGLGILDAFARPTTLRDALGRLEGRVAGAEDWMDVTATIVRLHRSGVLHEVDQETSELPVGDGGFGDPTVHAMMLNDRARTSGFLRAIERVVRPGDVVLDIGTGTGVLAVGAARAGAARVYAIEAGAMAGVARQVIEANGVADRVSVLEGWSTQVALPERADVLVAEIIGEMPFQERVLEVTRDARARLLGTGARLVPSRLRMYGLPVAIPSDLLATRAVTPEAVDRWRGWYSVDLSKVAEAARGLSHVLMLDPSSARSLRGLADPVLLADIDLASFDEVSIASTAPARATGAGAVNGVLAYFELDLAPSVALSTDPRRTTNASSWRNPVWIFSEPIAVGPGDPFRVSLSYREPGRPNGVRIARA
jgi:predicted nicotinamide N-methyase